MPSSRKHLILLTVFLAFSSCATLKSIYMAKDEDQAGEIKRKTALDTVKKKLDALVLEAKDTGKYAIDYLASDLYIKANDASVLGDIKTAMFLYEYILKLKDDDFIRKKYAIELIKSGELAKSEQILAKLYKKNKYRDEKIGLILAGIYSSLNKTEDARKTYRIILARNKKSEEACIFLAKSYIEEQKLKYGNQILDNCFKKNKKAIYVYYKGKVALERGKLNQALKYFRRALKIESNFYQAAIGLGVIYEEKKQHKKAIRVYKKYLKKDPSNYVVLLQLVQIMFSQGKFKKVIPYVEKLAAIDHDNANLKIKLGILYIDAKKYQKAIDIFNTVLQGHPESDQVLYYLGSLHNQINTPKKALEYFSQIPADSPLFQESVLQTANILLLSAKEGNNVDKFINFIEDKSNKISTLKIDLSLLLTGYYEGISNYPKAIAILKDLEGQKGFEEGHKYYLASLYEKNKNYKKAHGIIEDILKKDPENPHALNFLGYSLLEIEGDLDKAYYYIEKAVKLRPDDGFIRDSLGWYYYKKGDLKKALAEVKKAWKQIKDDVVIAKHLA
ncbi:MAG: tetratricopeptide repeat protein, partial [Halobacteriovoraceae bacterium]|nr:tetratricopeptide repeat protein [Halobacteriovoraceae bacterium]